MAKTGTPIDDPVLTPLLAQITHIRNTNGVTTTRIAPPIPQAWLDSLDLDNVTKDAIKAGWANLAGWKRYRWALCAWRKGDPDAPADGHKGWGGFTLYTRCWREQNTPPGHQHAHAAPQTPMPTHGISHHDPQRKMNHGNRLGTTRTMQTGAVLRISRNTRLHAPSMPSGNRCRHRADTRRHAIPRPPNSRSTGNTTTRQLAQVRNVAHRPLQKSRIHSPRGPRLTTDGTGRFLRLHVLEQMGKMT